MITTQKKVVATNKTYGCDVLFKKFPETELHTKLRSGHCMCKEAFNMLPAFIQKSKLLIEMVIMSCGHEKDRDKWTPDDLKTGWWVMFRYPDQYSYMTNWNESNYLMTEMGGFGHRFITKSNESTILKDKPAAQRLASLEECERFAKNAKVGTKIWILNNGELVGRYKIAKRLKQVRKN